MRSKMLVVLAGCLVTAAGTNATEFVDSELSPADVIERMKEVRRDWETVEIEFVHYERLAPFDGPKSRLKDGGRFTLTPDDCGELESYAVDDDGRRLKGEPSDRFVWTPDEFQVYWGDGRANAVLLSEFGNVGFTALIADRETGSPESNVAQNPSGTKNDGLNGLTSLCGILLSSLFSCLKFDLEPIPLSHSIAKHPKDCLPLVFADDADQLAERFDLTVKETSENIFLFAHPKLAEDQRNYCQTAICIDRDTFIPFAKRTALPNGHYYHTWLVTSLHVNGEPIEVSQSAKDQSAPE